MMDSIGEFYKNIFKNFIRCSVVYLPSFLMEEMEKLQNDGDSLDYLKYADTVSVFDREGHNLVPEKTAP